MLVPLAVFALLAASVGAGPLAFDLPLLWIAQRGGGGRLDAAWSLVSHLGYEWGVVPVDLALVAALLLLRRWRAALFAAVALGGSGLLNVGAKLAFGRVRPDLWESIAPEHNFSFPSGHAMGSMTLACVLALLLWRTPWRRPAIAGLAMFVAAVGWSRIHLGVHFPSDILAGWALGLAWTVAWWIAFARGARAP
jgi:undecaprenyl-diphosphatase